MVSTLFFLLISEALRPYITLQLIIREAIRESSDIGLHKPLTALLKLVWRLTNIQGPLDEDLLSVRIDALKMIETVVLTAASRIVEV